MSNIFKSQRLAAALLLGAISLFGQGSTPGTQVSQPAPEFPAVGLATTETAQVNVTNIAGPGPGPGLAPSCAGDIELYATDAKSGLDIFIQGAGFSVTSGQTFSVTLPYSRTGSSAPRQLVHAVINNATHTLTAQNPVPPLCTLESSLEIFDTSTGVVHSVVRGEIPQKTPYQQKMNTTSASVDPATSPFRRDVGRAYLAMVTPLR